MRQATSLALCLALLSATAYAQSTNQPPTGGGGGGGGGGGSGTTGTIVPGVVGQLGVYVGPSVIGSFLTGGDLTFNNPNFSINNGAVTSGKLAAGAAANNLGAFTGDVIKGAGLLSTTVGALRGNQVSANVPTLNQILQWNGSSWTPSTLVGALTSFSANAIPKGAGTSPFAVSSIIDAGAGVTIGAPTGAGLGIGTINTTGVFVNGVAVGATTCQALTNGAPSCFTDTTNAANILSGDLTAARMSANLSIAHDVAFGSAPGETIYRGPSGWQALLPGTAGQVLTTQGSSPPQWTTITATAGGTAGQLQINSAGVLGGLGVGPSLSASGGALNVAPAGVSSTMLAPGAASSNIGAFGQDVSGTAPNLMVMAINGATLGNTSPAAGNALFGSGTQWVSRAITGDVSFSSTGVATVTIANGSITAPKLASGAASSNLGAAGQDLSGTFPNPTVIGLQGRSVTSATPSTGNLLGWNGTAWGPTTAPVTGINQLTGAVTSGPGSGTQVATIAPTGVTAAKYTVRSDSGATTDCWTVASTGQIVLIETATPCAATPNLTADDGATTLTADDGSTVLTAL